MATHSSVLAWRIPGTGEPGGLPDVYGVAQSQTRLKRLSSSSSLGMIQFTINSSHSSRAGVRKLFLERAKELGFQTLWDGEPVS